MTYNELYRIKLYNLATYSSIITWRIPSTENSSGLQFMGSQRVRHDWVTEDARMTYIYILTKLSLLSG